MATSLKKITNDIVIIRDEDITKHNGFSKKIESILIERKAGNVQIFTSNQYFKLNELTTNAILVFIASIENKKQINSEAVGREKHIDILRNHIWKHMTDGMGLIVIGMDDITLTDLEIPTNSQSKNIRYLSDIFSRKFDDKLINAVRDCAPIRRRKITRRSSDPITKYSVSKGSPMSRRSFYSWSESTSRSSDLSLSAIPETVKPFHELSSEETTENDDYSSHDGALETSNSLQSDGDENPLDALFYDDDATERKTVPVNDPDMSTEHDLLKTNIGQLLEEVRGLKVGQQMQNENIQDIQEKTNDIQEKTNVMFAEIGEMKDQLETSGEGDNTITPKMDTIPENYKPMVMLIHDKIMKVESREFARSLGIDDNAIDTLDARFSKYSTKEFVYQVLRYFLTTNPSLTESEVTTRIEVSLNQIGNPICHDPPMTEEQRKQLVSCRRYITENLVSIGEVCDHLMNANVLTQVLYDDVLYKPKRLQQVEALLDILPTRGDTSFGKFCNALIQTGQNFIASKLDGDENINRLCRHKSETLSLARFRQIPGPESLMGSFRRRCNSMRDTFWRSVGYSNQNTQSDTQVISTE